MADRAVIIAAGMGSRLNGHGRGRPKPLVKVAGVGLLKRAILTAKRAGINQFAIVIGYRGDEIRSAIANDPQIDVHIDWVENDEWTRGNGLSVLKARDFVEGRFLLMMADHLFEPRVITRMRRLLLSAGESALCVDTRLDRVQDLDDATKVVLGGERILRIGKALDQYDAVDTGIFLCTPALFDGIERSIARGDESLSGGVRILASEGNMRAVEESTVCSGRMSIRLKHCITGKGHCSGCWVNRRTGLSPATSTGKSPPGFPGCWCERR